MLLKNISVKKCIKTVVKKFKELDSSGDLETIMNVTNKLGGPVCTHEGWILGAMA